MILVCGEAVIDAFVGPPDGACLPSALVAGGSPFSMSIGLSRLGCPAAFLGGLSHDRFGDFLAGRLAAEDVDMRFAPRLPNPTTISVVATDANGHPAYSFYGENAADRSYAPEHLPPDLGDEIEAIALTSYVLMTEPVATALLTLARRESGRRLISLDPNLRPALVGDITTWPDRFRRFVREAAIVKASAEDIALAFGPSATVDDVAAEWLADGPALVVVTRGPDGAAAYRPGERIEVPGRRVDVVDTVGAGDAFHAALLARLRTIGALDRAALARLPRDHLSDVLRFAVAASSIVCGRRGADMPDETAVLMAMRQG